MDWRSIGLLILIGGLCHAARADDVYNFYFQKAPAPQTVIQGNPPANVTVETKNTADGSSTTTTIATKKPDKRDSGWEVTLGYTEFNDTGGSYSGVGTEVVWRPIRYVGLAATLLYGTLQTNYLDESDLGATTFRYALGVNVTPVRIHVFGQDLIAVSALFGAVNFQSVDSGMQLGPYFGLQVQLDLTETFGLCAESRQIPYTSGTLTNTTQYIFGLTARL